MRVSGVFGIQFFSSSKIVILRPRNIIRLALIFSSIPTSKKPIPKNYHENKQLIKCKIVTSL